MAIEQAIFTSVRNGRLEGYQLAAVSGKLSRRDAKELTAWGPGHDSLSDRGADAESTNFHRLKSGLYCVSTTTAAGPEYSGRGGVRIHTHLLLAPPEELERFANHPFRLLAAAQADGALDAEDRVPDQLPSLQLSCRARDADADQCARLNHLLGPEKLAVLLRTALASAPVGLISAAPPNCLMAVLMDLTPRTRRAQLSFSTGLRVSPRRPFQLNVLSSDAADQRRSLRQAGLLQLDLTCPPPADLIARRGWPRLVLDLLRRQRFTLLRRLLREADRSDQQDLDVLADRLRDRFHVQGEAAPAAC